MENGNNLTPKINLEKFCYGTPMKKIKEKHKETIETLSNISMLATHDRLRITGDLREIIEAYKEEKLKENDY